MSKALIVVPGKSSDVSPEVRQQFIEWASKGDFDAGFLDDSSIKDLANGLPVLFFPMTDRGLSVENNVLALMQHIDATNVTYNDSADISHIIDGVQKVTEADEKTPHLERGGFLGRGKRGAINYRRVK